MSGTSQEFEVSIEDANVSLSVSETVVSVHIESAKTEQDIGFSDEEVLVNGHTVNVELSSAGMAGSTNGGEISLDPHNALTYGSDGKLYVEKFSWATTQW